MYKGPLFFAILFSLVIQFEVRAQAKGVHGEIAPNWNVEQWIDAQGDPLDSLSIDDFNGKVIYILCFQHWCPGCHSHAFPTLQYLHNKYKDHPDIAFIALQTVFEGTHTNTFKKLRKTQKKYKLEIPFGHDDGRQVGSNMSAFMEDYKSEGTPWVIVIDKNREVVFNDFNLSLKSALPLLRNLLKTEVAAPLNP